MHGCELIKSILHGKLERGRFSHAQQVQVPDTLAQRVLACAACHGKEERATIAGYFPRIAGKPAGYLYNQLINFLEGRRQYPLIMVFNGGYPPGTAGNPNGLSLA